MSAWQQSVPRSILPLNKTPSIHHVIERKCWCALEPAFRSARTALVARRFALFAPLSNPSKTQSVSVSVPPVKLTHHTRSYTRKRIQKGDTRIDKFRQFEGITGVIEVSLKCNSWYHRGARGASSNGGGGRLCRTGASSDKNVSIINSINIASSWKTLTPACSEGYDPRPIKTMHARRSIGGVLRVQSGGLIIVYGSNWSNRLWARLQVEQQTPPN